MDLLLHCGRLTARGVIGLPGVKRAFLRSSRYLARLHRPLAVALVCLPQFHSADFERDSVLHQSSHDKARNSRNVDGRAGRLLYVLDGRSGVSLQIFEQTQG